MAVKKKGSASKKKSGQKPADFHPLTASGTQLASAIRKKQISSVEAVKAHIEQVRKFNPELNAMVYDRFAVALKEAESADRRLKRGGKLPPFFGVPCSIKECFALEGMPNTAGLVSRRDLRSKKDATAVARIRAAGAIPLGVTNTSELCMWMESNNKLYGRTSNPYDSRRIVGGSSGGEGVMVAAGGAPFGLGSDVGGSIRMPAFFNGIFGHKPSGGLIPNSGQYPIAKGYALRYLTTGPLARRAEDIWPLVKILAGADGLDEHCENYRLGNPQKVNFRKLKVIVLPELHAQLVQKPAADLKQAMAAAASELEGRGAVVEEGSFPELKHAFDIWSAMLYEGNESSFRDEMAAGAKVNFFNELLKGMIGRSDFTVPGALLALLENTPSWTKKRTKKMIERGQKLRDALNRAAKPQGFDGAVILFPSYSSAAPKHNKPMFPPFNWVHTAILNVMELPVTQVPLGLNRDGLPLGIQVASAHGSDHITVAVAMALEQAFGGWVPPRRWLGDV